MSEPRRVAIVTGASSGLGRAFAERLAARDHDLVLVARRRDRLDALAAELHDRHGVEVNVHALDLTDPAAPGALAAALRAEGRLVDVLINAAGFGTAGPFAQEDPARLAAEIAVDVTAPTLLTRHFLADLLSAPAGLLVMISSTASHQPTPNLAAYAASKAFITSLTSAIWQETRGSRLRAFALCPGPTATEFFEASGSEQFKVGPVATIDEVMDAAFSAIDRGAGPVVTVGLGNRLQALAAKLAPRKLTLAVGAQATERAGRADEERRRSVPTSTEDAS